MFKEFTNWKTFLRMEKNRYSNDLKKNNPEIYSEVIELKNKLEKDIVNVKEALLYSQEPILNTNINEN